MPQAGGPGLPKHTWSWRSLHEVMSGMTERHRGAREQGVGRELDPAHWESLRAAQGHYSGRYSQGAAFRGQSQGKALAGPAVCCSWCLKTLTWCEHLPQKALPLDTALCILAEEDQGMEGPTDLCPALALASFQSRGHSRVPLQAWSAPSRIRSSLSDLPSSKP